MDDRIIELLAAGDQQGIALLQQQYGSMVRYIVRGILRTRRMRRNASAMYTCACGSGFHL